LLFSFWIGLDVILSAIIARLSEPSDLLETAFFIFLGLQLVPLVFSIRKLIYEWVVFSLSREKSVRAIALVLAENGYPTPQPEDFSAEFYFDRLARDGALPDKVRMDAAVDLGFLKSHGQVGRTMTAVRTYIIYDDAIVLLRERAAGL